MAFKAAGRKGKKAKAKVSGPLPIKKFLGLESQSFKAPCQTRRRILAVSPVGRWVVSGSMGEVAVPEDASDLETTSFSGSGFEVDIEVDFDFEISLNLPSIGPGKIVIIDKVIPARIANFLALLFKRRRFKKRKAMPPAAKPNIPDSE